MATIQLPGFLTQARPPGDLPHPWAPLQMKNLLTASLLVFCAGCGGFPQDQNRAPALAVEAELHKARAFLDAGDADSALGITDNLLNDDSWLREALLLAAEANMALFRSGRSNAAALLADAANNYRRALDLDSTDALSWKNLSAIYFEQQELEQARSAAHEAAQLYRAAGEDAFFGTALLQKADVELRIFALARNEELRGEDKELQPETQVKAQTVLATLQALKRHLPGEGYLRAAEVYRWLGRTLQPGARTVSFCARR